VNTALLLHGLGVTARARCLSECNELAVCSGNTDHRFANPKLLFIWDTVVESIDGDFYTVMGFPLARFVRTLRRLGFSLPLTKQP